MYKAKDLRDQSLQELEALYEESCHKLFELNNELNTQKKWERPHEVRHMRRDIARLLTVITQKRRRHQTQSPKG